MCRIMCLPLLTGFLVAAAADEIPKIDTPKPEPAKAASSASSSSASPGKRAAAARSVPGDVEVSFLNGSTVRMLVQSEKVSIVTPYGMLHVPVKDIRGVEFGLHFPEGTQATVAAALNGLGSKVPAERNAAIKVLVETGPFCYPAVFELSRTKDFDAARSAKEVIKQLLLEHPRKDLKVTADDKVVTPTFTIAGRIVTPTLKARTELFGDVELAVAKMRSLRAFQATAPEIEVTVDAAKYAVQGQWLETACELDGKSAVLITAKGIVDTWPQQPGQYITGPNGTQGGRGGFGGGIMIVNGRQVGGQITGGALMGKIGERGDPFLLGERYEGMPEQEGKLYLHIGPSPWNCPSSGSYDVKIVRK